MKVPPIRKIKGNGMPREAHIVCAAATALPQLRCRNCAAPLAYSLTAKGLQRRTGGSLDPIEGKNHDFGLVQALPTIPAGECRMLDDHAHSAWF
jgi:hypothetical protein